MVDEENRILMVPGKDSGHYYPVCVPIKQPKLMVKEQVTDVVPSQC